MSDPLRTLPLCGVTSGLVQTMDWSRTRLGPPGDWPAPVSVAVGMALGCGFPASVLLGPDPGSALMIYNDAFIAFLGRKHPAAMGRRAREVWPEIWDFFEWALRQAGRTGCPVTGKDLALRVERGDDLEEIYASLSFSPIRGPSGEIHGSMVSGLETTAAVVGERRGHALWALSDSLNQARSEDELYRVVAASLSAAVKDIAYALLYVLDADGRTASLRVATGLSEGAAPLGAEVAVGSDAPWDLAGVIRAREMRVVASSGVRLSALVSLTGTPRLSAVVPVLLSTQDEPLGVLVVGLNPSRPFDSAYDTFVRLIAHQIASSLANVRRLQEARRQAEALAALDRAKTMFLANVSHELRTPLTLLLGPTEDLLARDGEPLSDAQRAQLEIVRRNVYRLHRYVSALLAFARTDAGPTRAEREPTDLAGFTREIASAFVPLAARAGLRFVMDCPSHPEPVPVAREMWEQIVLNLLSNALKFTFAGEIAVRLRLEGETARLTVRDTGIGIPAAALPQVFERFYHVPGARARTAEGIGIGLALVKELALAHGGSVQVASAPGDGSTFTVTIPRGPPADHPGAAASRSGGEPPDTPRVAALAAAAAATPAVPRHVTPFLEDARGWLGPTAPPSVVDASPPPAEGPDPTGRILIAEDCADMSEYLRRVLGPTYEVESVSDGAMALRAVRDRPPDLVLSDVVMPELDGIALLRALRADPATQDIPVVLLSARGGEDATVDSLSSGADDYLVKPFSARELKARVRTHLALARARREAGESRLKDVFLGLASHELRTPLTCLKLNVQFVQRGLEVESPRLSSRMAGLSRSIDRMTRLVEEMLAISAISAGKLPLHATRCDVVELCRSVAAEQAQVSGREIVLDLPDGPIRATVDEDRIGQVLQNLLSNAIKYSGADRPVYLALRAAEQEAIVTVRDRGPGIPPESLPHLFERFYRAPGVDVRSGSYQGLGLGLYLARGIVEQHAGRIWAESILGEGSAFSFTLPLAA